MQSHAAVVIPRARRYGKQLAGHLGHRLDVTETADGWMLVRGDDIAHIVVGDDVLTLSVTATNTDGLASFQDVLERHLRKFSAKEGELQVDWQADN